MNLAKFLRKPFFTENLQTTASKNNPDFGKKNGNKEESDSKNVLQNSNKANLKYISKRRLLGEVRKIKHFQKYHDLQAINLTVIQ